MDLLCDNINTKYFIISNNIPSLVYYSHISLIVVGLFIVFFILVKSNRRSWPLLAVFCPFIFWLFFSLVTWANDNSNVIMFVWSLIIIVEPLIYIGGLYLIKSIRIGKNRSLKQIWVIILAYIPIIILSGTGLTLIGFNLDTCSAIEGPVARYYVYIIEITYIIMILFYSIQEFLFSKELKERTEIVLISCGLIIFLLTFTAGNITGSFTGDWKIGAFGLIGMPIFLIFLFYSIANYETFNLKLTGKKVLIFTYWILILSLITISDIYVVHTVVSITFVVSIFIGLALINSIDKESQNLLRISSLASSLEDLNSTLSEKVAEQTQEIRKLYELEKKSRRDLEKLNETKDKFIMIAQHNLRIPVTNLDNKIKTLTAELQGKIVSSSLAKLKDTEVSIKHLAHIADDFKNIAQLKVGSNILTFTPTNINNLINDIVLELKIDIENMWLTVNYPARTESCILNIDSNKIRDVLLVVIENAVRYNKKNGSITILIEKNNKEVQIVIENSGIGINQEETNSLNSHSFYRGPRAKSANPIGMGIGLSISRSIVEAHHGSLDIESEGEGAGARVVIILPVDFLKEI